VSVASWRLPLDDEWFASLVLVAAGNLAELRRVLPTTPLTMAAPGEPAGPG
jgi:hypothetical protein